MSKSAFKYMLIVGGEIKGYYLTLKQATVDMNYYLHHTNLFDGKTVYVTKIIIIDGEVVE